MEVVSVLLTAIIIVMHAIYLFMNVARNDRESPNTCVAIFGRFLLRFQAQRPEEHEDEERICLEHSRLAARLLEIRLESYVVILDMWMHIFAVCAVDFLIRRMLGLLPLSSDMMMLTIIVIYVSAFVVRAVPGLVDRFGLMVLHHWFMGLLFTYGACAALMDASVFEHYSILMLIGRLSLSVALPSNGTNWLWNLAWAGLAVVSKHSSDGDGRIHVVNAVGNELIIFVCLSCVIWRVGLLQSSQVRSDVRASWYLRAKQTMATLMADMCDAVVDLDQNLLVRQPCAKLAGLLLRDTGSNFMTGEDFVGLVSSEEDRERFRTFVAQRAVPIENQHNLNGNRSGSSMYLHLKDAIGTPVSVQLFHSCHAGSPNDICHVVGVRELERNIGTDDAMDTVGQAPEIHQDVSADHEIGESDSIASMGSARSSSGSSSISLRLMPHMPENSFLTQLAVAFNGYTDEVIACTRSFESLTGPLPYKTHLRNVIVNFDDFERWVQVEVNGTVGDHVPSPINLRLTPVAGKMRTRIEFHATAAIFEVYQHARASALGVMQPDNADQEEFNLLIVMVLGEVESRGRTASDGSRSSRRNRDARGSPAQSETFLM